MTEDAIFKTLNIVPSSGDENLYVKELADKYNKTTDEMNINLFWTCIYLRLGYWFGDSWESIVPVVTQFGQFLTYITILIIVLNFFIKIVRNKKRKTDN